MKEILFTYDEIMELENYLMKGGRVLFKETEDPTYSVLTSELDAIGNITGSLAEKIHESLEEKFKDIPILPIDWIMRYYVRKKYYSQEEKEELINIEKRGGHILNGYLCGNEFFVEVQDEDQMPLPLTVSESLKKSSMSKIKKI